MAPTDVGGYLGMKYTGYAVQVGQACNHGQYYLDAGVFVIGGPGVVRPWALHFSSSA